VNKDSEVVSLGLGGLAVVADTSEGRLCNTLGEEKAHLGRRGGEVLWDGKMRGRVLEMWLRQ